MKKTSFLLFMSLLLSLGLYAQDKPLITNKHINPAENQTWWGYFDGDMENVKGIGAGEYSEPGMTYDCAIFIPGDHSMGKGKTIKALRIYFASIYYISNLKVWLSKTLPNSADEADIEVKSIDYKDISDGAMFDDPENDFAFDNAYTIGDEGVYVGYSFTMDNIESLQDMLPVVVSYNPSVTEKNANFISTGWGWEDFSGKEGMGNLALRVLMEGDFKNDVVDASPAFSDVYCVKNTVAEIPVTLINMGGNGLDNISYVVSTDGVRSDEKVLSLNSHVEGIGTKFRCNIPVQTDDVASIKNIEIDITKVNGNENTSASGTLRGRVISLSELVTRKVVIEEYTGTWTAWAPRSYAGLEKAVQVYGDDVVITSAHYGEDDPMKCDDYIGMYPEYAPESNVSREVMAVDSYYGTHVDDVWGMNEIIQKLRATAPVAKVRAEGIINEEGTKVTANSYTTFLFNGSDADYSLAYVLKTSGLKGDTPEWVQDNMLASYKNGEFDFDPVFSKWVNSPEEITDMVYNDVPVATIGLKQGVDGSISLPVVEGDVQKYSVEFDLNSIGSKIQNKSELYLCVYLIDRASGVILNADCKKVTDLTHSAIRDARTTDANEVIARYSADGTLLSSPVKGINILKYSDGRTLKVVVR